MTLPLLLTIYTLILGYFILRSKAFMAEGIPKGFMLGVFLLKILVGCFYGWIHRDYFHGGDTFLFLSESVQLYESFLREPAYFLGLGPAQAMEGLYRYPPLAILFKDFGTYAFIHLQALLQPLTQGHYTLHIVFMAFVGSYAGLQFFKALKGRIPVSNNLLLGLIFFMPSVLFWTSGLHKDGLVYLGLAWVLYGLSLWASHRAGLARLVLGLFFIGIFRSYLLALLIPAITAFVYSHLQPQQKPLWVFTKVYFFWALAVLGLDYVLRDISILNILVERQSAFAQEAGKSSFIVINHIQEGWAAVWAKLPEALINVTMRPFLWECRDFLQVLASLEIMAMLGLGGLWFLDRRPSAPLNSLMCLLLFYALSNLLLIGLLVNNVGTIVRYRAIALGFIVLVMGNTLDFIRLPFGRAAGPQPLKMPTKSFSQKRKQKVA